MKLGIIASAFAAACLVAVSATPAAAATHKGGKVALVKTSKAHKGGKKSRKVVTGGYG